MLTTTPEPVPALLLRGRLDGHQRLRLVRLLDMPYTPGELAEEIGFSARQFYRVYLSLGCPHEKDKRGRIWINGAAFREWVGLTYPKPKIGEGEAFCLTCKGAVAIVNPETKHKGGVTFLTSSCPGCGRTLAKILKRDGRR